MFIQFDCPTCNATLRLENAESIGPCPTCQTTLQVKLEINVAAQDSGEDPSDAVNLARRHSGKSNDSYGNCLS